MFWFLSPLLGLSHFLWSRTVDAFDIGNGLFGSVVAVTGDAHQAQVAQDIFRQEVQIERSLRIREDIRDVHTLMIDNVQTQLLMGNILLGVCFAVLIEGKPDYEAEVPSPVLVQELWAAFSMWSITLLFLSVWFALRFQEVVSLHARKRLLEKHRICTPNDEIVHRMGGMSLAENVSQLHQSGLDHIQNAMSTNYGLANFHKYIGEPMGLTPHQSSTKKNDGTIQVSNSSKYFDRSPSEELEKDDCGCCPPEHGAPAEDVERSGAGVSDLLADDAPEHDLHTQSMTSAVHGPSNFSLGQPARSRISPEEGALEIKVVHAPIFEAKDADAQAVVTAKRGLQAWYEKMPSGKFSISRRRMIDLPEFLMGEQLIRCRWNMRGFQYSRRVSSGRPPCTVEFFVSGPATVYVAAHQTQKAHQAAFRSKVPLVPWKEDELPVLLEGGCKPISCRTAPHSSMSWLRRRNIGTSEASIDADHKSCFSSFNRVEGFSIYVDEDKMELPIYRAVLGTPDEEHWKFVQLQFRFKEDFMAPVVIVRNGQVTTTEEDWPVTEFLDELQDIWPLKNYSTRYMTLGTVSLVLAAFFAHLGRVLSDRPRESTQEIVIVAVPLLLAVVLALYVIYWDVRHIGIETQTDIHDGHHIADSDEAEDGESTASGDESPEAVAGAAAASSLGATEHHVGRVVNDMDESAAGQPVELHSGVGGAYFDEADRSVRVIEMPALERRPLADGISCWPACGQVACDAEETVFSTPASNATRSVKTLQCDRALSSPPLAKESDVGMSSTPADKSRRASVASQVERPCPNKRNSKKHRLSCWCRHCAVPRVTQQNLQRSFSVVLTLWFATLAWIIIAAWTRQRHCFCCAGELWILQDYTWPSLPFAPSAATLAEDGRLMVASRWLLTRGDGLPPVRLPVAARGLLAVAPGRLLLADGGELRLVDLANVSSSSRGASDFSLLGGPAVEVGAVGDVVGFLPVALPSQAGELLALAVATALPGGDDGVVAVASSEGGVLLCSAIGLDGMRPEVHALTHVPPLAGHPQVALHICSAAELDAKSCGAGEPVVWSADASGCLTAVELASGRVHEWQWEAGHGPAALAGNLTHLFVVAGCDVGDGGLAKPTVRTARYDRLFDEPGVCDRRGT